jgi:hypothetical protein
MIDTCKCDADHPVIQFDCGRVQKKRGILQRRADTGHTPSDATAKAAAIELTVHWLLR